MPNRTPLPPWLVQKPAGRQAQVRLAKQKLSSLSRTLVFNEYHQDDYEDVPDRNQYGLLDPRNNYYEHLSANRNDRKFDEFERAKCRSEAVLKRVLTSRDVSASLLCQVACLSVFSTQLASFASNFLSSFDHEDLYDGGVDTEEAVREQIRKLWSHLLFDSLCSRTRGCAPDEEDLIMFGLRCMAEGIADIYKTDDFDDDELLIFGEDECNGMVWNNPPRGFRPVHQLLTHSLQVAQTRKARKSIVRIALQILHIQSTSHDFGLAFYLTYLRQAGANSYFISDDGLNQTIDIFTSVFGSSQLDSWLAVLMSHAMLLSALPEKSQRPYKRRRLTTKSLEITEIAKRAWCKVASYIDMFLSSSAMEASKQNLILVLSRIHNPFFQEDLLRERHATQHGRSSSPSSGEEYFDTDHEYYAWSPLMCDICRYCQGSVCKTLRAFFAACPQESMAGLVRQTSICLVKKVSPETIPFLLDLQAHSRVSDVACTTPWRHIFQNSDAVRWLTSNLEARNLSGDQVRELGVSILQSRDLANIERLIDFVSVERFNNEEAFRSEITHLKFELLTKAHECCSVSEFDLMLRLRPILPAAIVLEIASECMQAEVFECAFSKVGSKLPTSRTKTKDLAESSWHIVVDLVATGAVRGSGALQDCLSLAWVVTRFKDLNDVCQFVRALLRCDAFAAEGAIKLALEASNADVHALVSSVTEFSDHIYGSRRMQPGERRKASAWIDMILGVLRSSHTT